MPINISNLIEIPLNQPEPYPVYLEEETTRIAISSGHGLRIRGAFNVIDEVTEARRVVRRIVERLEEMGVEVEEFHDEVSTTVTRNLEAIRNWHNEQNRDIDVSVHFNAVAGLVNGAIGTEVLYTETSVAASASRIATAMSNAGNFILRRVTGNPHPGTYHRTDLDFLNSTDEPAVILEICFVNSVQDARNYQTNFEALCLAIAESLVAEAEVLRELEDGT